ncbi:DUF1525 domain-containing protein [Cellvibrio sp. PSBB023]|uniref:DUF1525 domain-containing protein n=1 Tax=Cellvibrio sp. PSBB023 TaxID=1945512 RepID=UPI00098FB48B|nr:DUF1525 domain-containing protein [Cellvibrio sp. PSBB023]AQT61896.1 hypothetical protein B0D95_18635 [Cellvibrio sp. PSBB023]
MKFIANRIMLAGLFLVFAASSSQAQTLIEVFTDLPALIDAPTDVKTVHYDLSEVSRLKQTGLPKLPPNQEQAMKMANAFFATPKGEAFKSEMRAAMRGQQKMMKYQIKKVPAIVFDEGKYVVYGSTDVFDARRLYLATLEERTDGEND